MMKEFTQWNWVAGTQIIDRERMGQPEKRARNSVRQYEFVKLLGEGASAAVFLAEDITTDREVVLKVSNSELRSSVGFLEVRKQSHPQMQYESPQVGTTYIGTETRLISMTSNRSSNGSLGGLDDRVADQFMTEIRALQHLRHPGIVRLHDCFVHRGLFVQVLDRVRGRTLDTVVKEKNVISLHSGLRFLDAILKILRFIHSQKFVHRDIKPQNIMINQFGLPIMIDFGTSVPMSFLSYSAHALTPSFAAPEAFLGATRQTEPSDIFSAFSTVMWAMFPTTPINAYSTFHRSMFGFHGLPLEIQEQVLSFFGRGLAASANDRFASAAEALDALSLLNFAVDEFVRPRREIGPNTPVFVSYSSQDRAYVQHLVDLIRKAGMKPWIDVEAIPGGSKWAESIENGLRQSEIFFLLCTMNSVGEGSSSEFVTRELHRAISLGLRIVPILFDDVMLDPSIEWLLSGTQCLSAKEIDFDDPRSLTQKLQHRP
jgi:serine/threonine protein kinase